VSIAARLFRGLPPVGLGVYVWQGEIPPGAWDFYAVSYTSRTLIASMLASGASVWLFAGPDAWAPGAWRSTLANMIARLESEPRLVGLVANPEEAWRGASTAEVEEFGRALAAASERFRVGVVTIPAMPSLERLVRAAGDGVWWSIELYARSAAPASFASWGARWLAMMPRSRFSVTPAAFVPDTDLGRATMATRDTYRAYLAALPTVASAIVWGNNGTLRSRPWMAEELRARFSAVRVGPLALAFFLERRAALIIAAAAVVVGLFVVAGAAGLA
jgi:hypothetical protein